MKLHITDRTLSALQITGAAVQLWWGMTRKTARILGTEGEIGINSGSVQKWREVASPPQRWTTVFTHREVPQTSMMS